MEKSDMERLNAKAEMWRAEAASAVDDESRQNYLILAEGYARLAALVSENMSIG